MSNYIIGGWSQNISRPPRAGFSYTMYGMITNLEGLTSGTVADPGWSPENIPAPNVETGKVLWTYGGGFCSPDAMPANEEQVQAIVACTEEKGWAGVDFDDECSMNIDNIINAMRQLKPAESSYTFLAGSGYNHPSSGSTGQYINDAVQKINNVNVADRFILMCYADIMWSMDDIKDNVGPAINRTINDNGVDKKKVILALTPAGLDSENLNYFLDQVIEYDIGGLFIWDFPALKDEDLQTIKSRLDIA